jgi:microcystin degradation protein MlrC
MSSNPKFKIQNPKSSPRVAIGQLWQETNTFNPLPTTRREFEQFGVLRGQEILEQLSDTNELGGFIQTLGKWPEKPAIVPLVRLPAWPSGTATADTLAWLRSEMLDALARAMPLDGVLLALHGAMVADGAPDVEGEILEGARKILGPGTPLVASLDLHANITERMAAHADALVLYHTAPHVDVVQTAVRAAGVLRRILIGGARPVTAFQKVPAVFPAERANTENPASFSHSLKLRLQQLETRPQVLTAGLATVQPWLDIPELGSSVVVTSDGNAEFAFAECARLASEVWQGRREYLPELIPAETAVREAHASAGGLVVLSDSADATTSGAPGDSNWVLQELMRYDWPRGALVTLVAPEVVRQAQQAGVGSEIDATLGGVLDNRFSEPIAVHGKVERLFDARFKVSGHLGKNLAIDMGTSAVLAIGSVSVVLTSRSGPHFAPELFQAAGFDPFAASVLVAKSPCGFRAAYQTRASKILLVKAPGCAPSDFWNYPYHQIPRPLWPWDGIGDWTPSPKLFGARR